MHTKIGRRNAIHAAIKKYGAGTFRIETLLISNDIGYLRFMEKRAIPIYGTMFPNGYNLTLGGEGSDFWYSGSLEKVKAGQRLAWARNYVARVIATAPAIAAMTASRENPVIEIPRRARIKQTMKSIGIGRGDSNAMAKITAGCAARIKDMLACRVKMRLIAEYFGVSLATVSAINCGKRWAHV